MRHAAPRRTGPPTLVLVTTLVAAVVTGAAALVASGLEEPRARYATTSTTPTTSGADQGPTGGTPGDTTPEEVVMLRSFDRARAAAWAEPDPAALGALYAPGSAAGRRDVAALSTYADRGLRVEGLRSQVLSAELRRSTERVRVIWVTDRIAGGEVVDDSGGSTTLPADTATRRELTWRRVAGDWLLDAVREV